MNTLMYYMVFIFIVFTITFFVKRISHIKNKNLDFVPKVSLPNLIDNGNKSSSIYRNRMTSGNFNISVKS